MSDILTAARNARTIYWLSRQSAEFIELLRGSYAKHFNCPLCEVNEAFESNEELEWVYIKFPSNIEREMRAGQ